MNRRKRFSLYNESTAGIVFTLPFTIGFLVFLIVPMSLSLYYAFTDFNILADPVFTGMKNLRTMLADDTFWKSFSVTAFYSVVSVPLKLIFALAVAMLLLQSTKITPLYRALYYLPSIIGGSVAVSILWKRMFAGDGMINQILQQVFGIEQTFSWLGNKDTAIWTLILLTVWQFGSSMLIFLASLKQIPNSYYEASRVDGAGRIKQFWTITLPLLTPTIFFNLVMQMINGFLAFTQCYIITQGRPLNSTLFYMVYMYQQSFEFYNTGYGAAMAWVMILVVSVVTGLIFATKKLWVYDGGV